MLNQAEHGRGQGIEEQEVVDRAAAAAFSLLDERRAEDESNSTAMEHAVRLGSRFRKRRADAYAGPHILKVVDRGDELIHLSTSTAFYTDVYAEVKDDETLRTMRRHAVRR